MESGSLTDESTKNASVSKDMCDLTSNSETERRVLLSNPKENYDARSKSLCLDGAADTNQKRGKGARHFVPKVTVPVEEKLGPKTRNSSTKERRTLRPREGNKAAAKGGEVEESRRRSKQRVAKRSKGFREDDSRRSKGKEGTETASTSWTKEEDLLLINSVQSKRRLTSDIFRKLTRSPHNKTKSQVSEKERKLIGLWQPLKPDDVTINYVIGYNCGRSVSTPQKDT